MLEHINNSIKDKTPSNEYIKCLDIMYDELGLTKQIDSFGIDFYIRLESIDKLCNYHHGSICSNIADLASFINMNPVVELLTKERLTNGIYAKVNINNNIRVYEGNDGNYYTAEKLNISKLELVSVKSLKDYVEEQQIHEGILRSWDSKTVKKKLIDFLEIYDDEIFIKGEDSNPCKIEINTNNIKLDYKAEHELKQFANLIGYTYTINGNNVILNPYHPKSANKLVKNNKNIVYHLTSKYFYNKIKDNEYIPLRSSILFPSDNLSKERIYCFCGNLKKLKCDIESFRRLSLRILKHNKLSEYYDKNVLLTIDVSDLDINWYCDPAYELSYKECQAIFTNGYIKTKNIINVQELKNGILDI